MNAKEWLIQEFEINEYSAKHHAFLTLFETSISLMERYANYKNKELFGLLFEFRNKIMLNGGLTDFLILKKFDEHFNIEKCE